MENNKLIGLKTALNKVLLYYVLALQDEGVEDIRQYLCNEIVDSIQLSSAQADFIRLNSKYENKILTNLKNSTELLSSVKTTNKSDEESINIVLKVMELMINDLENFEGAN